MRGDAGDRAVGEAPAAVSIDLAAQGVQKRPRQAARPERALIAPLLRLHEGEEAPEVSALHRPGARRGRHLDGKIRFQPAGEGVGAPLEVEAHRQAGLPSSFTALRAGFLAGISGQILSCSDLVNFFEAAGRALWERFAKRLHERYLL
jgi:hypothetical protein